MAFSAPTNSVPKTLIHVRPGNASPRIAPMTRPIMILMIRLSEFHFLITLIIISTSESFKNYLDRIIQKVGQEKGFDLIINAQTAIAITSGLDITDDIIEALDDEIKEIELKTK